MFSGLPLSLPSYPKDNIPVTLRLNRPAFETLIRRLVLNSCKNVRYLAGAALGLEKAIGSSISTGVRVRLPEGEEITLPVLLAVGMPSLSNLPLFVN